MKRVQKIVVMIGVAAAVVGCRKAELPTGGAGGSADGTLPDVENTIPISVTASTSTTDDDDFIITRTMFDGVNYRWRQYDALGLFAFEDSDADGTSVPVFENVEVVNHQAGNVSRAMFDGKLPDATFDEMAQKTHYKYIAYYPYHSQNEGVDYDYENGKIVGLKLDTEQTVRRDDNFFPVGYDYMFSTLRSAETIAQIDKSVDLGLEFHHLFSALKIYISESQIVGETVTKIKITAPEETHLCGGFTLSAQGVVEFTNPSNVLTLHIPDGAPVGTSVYAIVNNVKLRGEELDIEVETKNGYRYRCTRSGKNYVAGFIHDHELLIPKPNITLAKAYTSYNERNNNLPGNAIFVEQSAKVTMPDGYELVNGVVDDAGIQYTRGSETPENVSVGGIALNTPFGSTKENIPHTLWGQYQVRAYARIGSVNISSEPITVHVTGKPYEVNFVGAEALPSDWSGGNIVYKGYIGSSADTQPCVRIDRNGASADNITNTGWLVSPKFMIPSGAGLGVNVSMSAYHYRATTTEADATLYVNPSAGAKVTTKTNGKTIKSAVTYYNEATFQNLTYSVSLTSSMGNVALGASFKGGASFGVIKYADYFTIQNIRVEYPR